MVLVELEPGKKPVYFEQRWYDTLRVIKAMVHHDRDSKIIAAGRSRVGKSVLIMQACKFLDPTFNIDRIVYTPKDFVRVANKLPPGSAIMLDETRNAGGGDWAQGRESKIFIDYLNKIGQRNLYIFMLIPDFWDLRPSLATTLSHCLIHVYEEENTDFNPDNAKSDPMSRGHFDFYNYEHKKYLYYHSSKYRSYSGVKATFKGCDFSNTFVVDEEAYRKLKAGDLDIYENDDVWTGKVGVKNRFEKAMDAHKVKINGWINFQFVCKQLKENFPELTLQDYAKILKCPESTVQTNINTPMWEIKVEEESLNLPEPNAPIPILEPLNTIYTGKMEQNSDKI